MSRLTLSGPYGRGSRYLLSTERRVVAVRRHWSVLLPWGLGTLAAMLGALVITTSLPAGSTGPRTVIWLIAVTVLAVFCWQIAEWEVERFIVTDRRIVLSSGILTRKVGMMPLLRVTDMTYQRSVFGRLLGYGEFVVESAGQDQALSRINYLPRPDELYQLVSNLLFGPGGQMAPNNDGT